MPTATVQIKDLKCSTVAVAGEILSRPPDCQKYFLTVIAAADKYLRLRHIQRIFSAMSL